MGTWGQGLLDNDTACDALGDLCYEIVGDIVRLGQVPAGTDELCAAIGVLLQLSGYYFGLGTERGVQIVTAVAAHAERIESLPAEARRVMKLVMDGKGTDLAERHDPASLGQTALLNKGATESRFGERHAALFATPAGSAYAQLIANRCVERIEDELGDADNCSDLCREAGSMGLLGVLMVLAPCSVPLATIESWRGKALKGLAELREQADDELEFHEAYYKNLDGAFDVLALRFA